MKSCFLRSLSALLFFGLSGFGASLQAAVPVPLQGSTPVALDHIRVNNPAVLPLAGAWRFQLTHGSIIQGGFVQAGNGPATASSSQDGHPAGDALDGLRTGTGWCASDGTVPQWWMVDLGKSEQVRGLAIDWEFKDAFYRFKAEGSADGQAWKLLADRTAPPGAHDGPVTMTPGIARYLRITIVGADRPGAYAWACIHRVGILVEDQGKTIPWTPHIEAIDTGKRDAFARADFLDQAWKTIPVPANWEMEGFSKPTYNNPDDAVGMYRRWIAVPASFGGKRVLWHFDGVLDGAEIFVNGKPCGYHESGFTAFDVDVTDALRSGERNLLALRVSKQTPSVDLDTGDFWCLGGIYRENYLVALPPTHVRDLTLVTDLDGKYKDATLTLTANMTGTAGATASMQGTLFDSRGTRVAGVRLHGETRIGADGVGTVRLESQVQAPHLWSAEKPTLYFVVLTLSEGAQTVERVQERFGFRKVEIRHGVLLWNGVAIKCSGSCRYEEWAAYGHALNEHCWRTDLHLMKGCNINAIRTSHYNHAARFLELCDEMGMYVLDEVPACWCNVDDPSLKDAFVQRTRETLERDRNRPCVLAWSLSNESGYGPNTLAMFTYAKTHDPTRPAFISQCGPWNNPQLDLADTHYPSFEEVKRMATESQRRTTPLVMTEQPHIFYVSDGLNYDYGEKDLWGQVLARNWSVVWPTDSILGSFIWEWQDQGIADKFPDRQGVDAEGLRDNNHKGVVDGYRNVKPEYWNVKMVYSPVTTAAREIMPAGGNCIVPLQNRYAFTDLAELTCKWRASANGRVLQSGEQRVKCPPHSSVSATFPAPDGLDTLHIEFIHPDGRNIYSANLHVFGPAYPPPPPASPPFTGTATVEENATEVRMEAGDTQLIVDKVTGTVRSWTMNGVPLITGGPVLNLGQGRENHGDHGAKDFVESKSDPVLKNVYVGHSAENGSARITIMGEVTLAESTETKGRYTLSLDLHRDASVGISWQLMWLAPDANAWELGVKLYLPDAMNRLTWRRQGLWTDYPKGHIGAVEGSANADEISFRSTKRDVRWAELSGTHQISLVAGSNGKPFHVRAGKTASDTVVFLSSAVSPPYDFSTNLVPDMLIHLKKGETVEGFVYLGVVGKR